MDRNSHRDSDQQARQLTSFMGSNSTNHIDFNFQNANTPSAAAGSANSPSPWNANSDYEGLRLPSLLQSRNYDIFFRSDDFNSDYTPDSPPSLPSSSSLVRPGSGPSNNQQLPPLPQEAGAAQESNGASQLYSLGFGSPSSDYGDPFSDYLAEGIEFQTPPPQQTSQRRSTNRTSTQTAPSPARNSPAIVDLTEGSPILSTRTMPPATRNAGQSSKRRRGSTDPPASERARKAARTKPSKSTPRTSPSQTPCAEGSGSPEVEVVDLVEVNGPADYEQAKVKTEEAKAKAKEEAAKKKQLDEANKPMKLVEFQCVICMESPTDLCVTHCGHLYCSECLHLAIHAENSKKICPICRSPIVVTPTPGARKNKQGIYHLELKFMTSKRKGKQPVKA